MYLEFHGAADEVTGSLHRLNVAGVDIALDCGLFQGHRAEANRINREGILRIVSSKERTQLANRRAAVHRLIELMTEAFHTPKPRRKTKVPAGAVRKRLETKAQNSAVKRVRRAKVSVED